jgi:hypothetical protein
MATRSDIWRKRAELIRWDIAERRRILEEHTKEFLRRTRELRTECLTSGGHYWEWKDLNPMGLNIYYCQACMASHIGELPESLPTAAAPVSDKLI